MKLFVVPGGFARASGKGMLMLSGGDSPTACRKRGGWISRLFTLEPCLRSPGACKKAQARKLTKFGENPVYRSAIH